MATVGFLREPQPGHVAHSALSAPFVTKPSYLDAAMFLSETAAPTALQMAAATQRFGQSQHANESAYNVAFNTPATFAGACEQRSKLQRQWPAYLRYGTGDVDASVTDILTRLDWLSLGNVFVVEVSIPVRCHVSPFPEILTNMRWRSVHGQLRSRWPLQICTLRSTLSFRWMSLD